MKFEFWPFPVLRNDSTNDHVTMLFLAFARSAELRVVERNQFWITLECEYGRMVFWCANGYYAWGGDGRFAGTNGDALAWGDGLPSRYAVRQMRRALKKVFQKALDEAAA